MKKILAIVFAALMLLSICACSAGSDMEKLQTNGVIKIGMECNYAPFNWTQSAASETAVALSNGAYADGYDVQIAKKIAEGLGVGLEIVPLDWDGLPVALQSGTIDAIIAGMSPTEERKLTIDFSDNYYESQLTIVVRKDGAYANATKLADFSGAKITGQLNTFHYSVIDQIPEVQKQTALNTFNDMILALQAGTIDGYVSEIPGARSAAAANPDLMFVTFDADAGFVASQDDTAIAIGVRKGSDMTEKLNEILAGISVDTREEIMLQALNNQPLSEE